MDLGQQPAGSHCRTDRQLRILPHGCMAEKPTYLYYSHSNGNTRHCSGMEKRPYLLQHHLSGRYNLGIPFTLLFVPHQYRQGEMQQVYAVCPQLQGIVHRYGQLSGRSQSMCGLYELHRKMQERCYPLPICLR